VTDVLQQNALYGTGAGSGDGVHLNAGKTGTTDNHADAWFDGYTRQLSTVVWMGYPKGEIPMLDVHGVSVAGATFPVPIWHEYMAAALWHRPSLPFGLPKQYPAYHYLTHGSYGSLGYVAPTTTAGTTTATTTTSARKTKTNAPAHTTTVAPPPKRTTTTSAPPPTTTTVAPPPAPPPTVSTTTAATTTEPPPIQ
jgi:membrane carboxypeptidase/penicillin-binding protein